MFCQKCGKKISDTDMFCSHCGTAITADTANTPTVVSKGSNITFTKIFFAILGAIGTFSFLAIIIKEKTSWYGYTYTPPFNEHETTMLLLTLVSIIILGVSLYSMTGNANRSHQEEE